ncbi:hypothetical protein HY839_00950 [Candidatus Azambacteria bacterium]|nr:hypothetical protein [Candidatus Azambacteria bacterium]
MQPQIVIENLAGIHNTHPQTAERLALGKAYKDLSTICIVPTRGVVPAKVVQSWMGMISPMNQKFTRIFAIGMEVGEAYSSTIAQILSHPELSQWKYILTLEEDNMPPQDGLLKLYENIDKYAAVGALYWTKGEGGQPMIYGEGKDNDIHFRPQQPTQDIQECDGLGMGLTLFQLDVFKDPRLSYPWFKTLNDLVPGQGVQMMTQDLYFFKNIRELGYKIACDTRVKVGHYDVNADIVW